MRRTILSSLHHWSITFTKAMIVFTGMLIVLVMFSEVVLRFVFNSPYPGPEEISVTTVLWLFFASAAYAVSLNFHITGGIPIKKESTKRKLGVVYAVLGLIVLIGFAILAFQYGFWVTESHVSSTALRIPYIWSMVGVLIGMVFMIGYSVLELVVRVRALGKDKKGNP